MNQSADISVVQDLDIGVEQLAAISVDQLEDTIVAQVADISVDHVQNLGTDAGQQLQRGTRRPDQEGGGGFLPRPRHTPHSALNVSPNHCMLPHRCSVKR